MSAPNIINELEEALADGSAERRAKTLHRITDLFAFGSGHFSKDHIALFDGVFNHLISVIEVSARAALAERLAAMPNAPPAAIRTLAFDDAIDVAGPVLSKSEQLDNATLVENANAKSQKHLLAISRRKSIAETVTDVLVERGDREVALTATRNAGAKFSEAGFETRRRSAGDDELTQSVGSRPEIPRHHFLKLLNAASHTVRLALEAAHPQSANDIQRVVGEAATAVQARVSAKKSHDYALARALVEKMRAAKQLGENGIETFARAGKFEETVAALAVMCRLSIEVVERAMVQDRVETVLIVAKSIGLSWPTVKAILLLRAGKRGISKHTLEEHMVSYTHLKPETAQRVVEFQRRR